MDGTAAGMTVVLGVLAIGGAGTAAGSWCSSDVAMASLTSVGDVTGGMSLGAVSPRVGADVAWVVLVRDLRFVAVRYVSVVSAPPPPGELAPPSDVVHRYRASCQHWVLDRRRGCWE